ncbi:hypothetical protein GQ602_000231 [Ophiocordyceps camponoti-floridani]|uniref:Uncharacterized protein n=1 Tax=Ophiocordyceps camponoti-floridani TaxID=2030778 RepID=A0A8H4QBT6_9HYPO|nr:hypothetical protein GQ602_000231 [Ophiocordyceps camponoti-floridani]
MEAYLFSLVADLLPPDLAAQAHHHLVRPDSPLQSCKRQLAASAYAAATAAADVAARALGDGSIVLDQGGGGSLAGWLALFAVLAVVVLAVRWVGRLVVWWTRLALRLASWAVVFALAACVWQRGVAATIRDVVVGGAALMRYLSLLRDVWLAEYSRYELQQQQQQQQGGQHRQFTSSRARGSAW